MGYSIGGILSGPIGNALRGIRATRDYRRVNTQYDADADRQYADALAEAEAIARNSGTMLSSDFDAARRAYRGAGRNARSGARQITRQAGQIYNARDRRVTTGLDQRGQALRDTNRAGYADLTGKYKQREIDILAAAQGLGDQEKKDIEKAWAQAEAANIGNVNERGLGGSTVLSSVRNQTRQQRGDEIGRANERLQRERLGLMTNLSGDTLGATERGVNADTTIGGHNNDNRAYYDASLSGDTAQARLNAMNNANNVDWMTEAGMAELERQWAEMNNANYLGTTGQHLGIVTGRDLVPPTPPDLTQAGANSVQPPKKPSFWQSAGPGITSGAASGVGTALAVSIFVGVCIDGESKLETPNGQVSLADIKVGDQVLNSRDEWKKVVAKHHRAYTGGSGTYIRINLGGEWITLSRNHPINGKPAEEWLTKNVFYEHAKPKSAGDILLEDGSDYMANGYVISSLISPSDIPTLEIMEPENQR